MTQPLHRPYIKQIVQTLGRDEGSDASAPYKMLRLFQLKMWLAWNDEDVRTLQDAAAQFVAITLANSVALRARRNTEATPAQLYTEALENQTIRAMFNEAFRSFRNGAGLYGLLYDHSLASTLSIVKNASSELACLDYLTEIRLRLAITPRKTSTLQNAVAIYKATYKQRGLDYAEAKLRSFNKARRFRAAFLFAARRYPWVLSFYGARSKTRRLLAEQIANVEGWRAYFAEVAGVEKLLADEEPGFRASGPISEWIGVEPVEPNLEPFSKLELLAVRLT